ncbi:unnamed protein product [Adineta steineri]|uniref:Uncharacterized protein n=1 Tax=Adineta steineri TaxID=433720 RepID=A0A818ZIG2_9BILA|nr:unnamed protein product [Adineta steineri]CAF0819590.1 unnamed protein product [Adineta steineri]CAF0926197.1 unnamed protein product [Adineta steineri]CAF3690927.1 unnamed protein product [Adineta steineri]CAF3772430.1 unnamed protein product [Adineta steineri]
MLFFRRRETSSQSNLTDQERCIHACLFFVFLLLTLTIVLFYFAITYKGTDNQRVYYYMSGGISLGFLLLISLCTVMYIRRFYDSSVSSTQTRRIISESDHENSKYSSHHP